MCSMQEIWSYIQNTSRNQVWFKTKCFWLSRPNLPITEVSSSRHLPRSGVFIVNFEHISQLVLVFLIVNFEQVNVDWAETEFKKKIPKSRISTLEYPCVLSFIWNKALWSFETNFTQNKYFGNGIWENNCQIQNEHPWIQLRTEFHSKQSILKFLEHVCPKKVFWGRNSSEQLSNSESAPLATSV